MSSIFSYADEAHHIAWTHSNLKEYVCHKVDKRIAELMKRKNRKRLAKEAEIARKEARGDYSHLKVRSIWSRSP